MPTNVIDPIDLWFWANPNINIREYATVRERSQGGTAGKESEGGNEIIVKVHHFSSLLA